MVTIQAKKLSSFGSVQGLMFKNKIEPVYFETRFGVHTFFVKHPIDVVILDDHNVVKKVTHALQPWRIFVWNPKWSRVVELPEGTIRKKKIVEGIKITLEMV